MVHPFNRKCWWNGKKIGNFSILPRKKREEGLTEEATAAQTVRTQRQNHEFYSYHLVLAWLLDVGTSKSPKFQDFIITTPIEPFKW